MPLPRSSPPKGTAVCVSIITLSFLRILASGPVVAQTAVACEASEITLVSSALDRIVADPQDVLADEDAFWTEQPAQVYTQAWADAVGYNMTRKQWREALEDFASLSPDQRRSSRVRAMAKEIGGRKESFTASAMPHICSFLPHGSDLNIPVYFTAFIPPRCFVTGGVIFNVSADYWHGNVDNIMNALVHELFHVGFSRQRPNRKLPETDSLLLFMAESLQNEGMATYVAYAARNMFPAPDELDFRLLEDGEKVTASLETVNDLLELIGSKPEMDVRRESWSEGVSERAYYIAGAHMASIIDARLGRPVLVQTILDGPLAFIDAYNSLVDDERRVTYPDDATIRARVEDGGGLSSLAPELLLVGIVLLSGYVFYFRRRRELLKQ